MGPEEQTEIDQSWEAPSLGLTPLSRVRLDQLLQEILDRVGEVLASRERLRTLLDAVVGIASLLDLRGTLERVIQAGCQLASARYGALGVLGEDGSLVEFISHGIGPDELAAIGDPPTGRGVLGLLIEDPKPLRVPDITDHAQSLGFPTNHPVMRSFLGVPIRVREEVFGNLYLADKQGAEGFTDDDEQLVVALAAAAGTAIDNARLYQVAQRRQRWLVAAAEITDSLLGRVHRTTALALVARRAREIAEADAVLILLHNEEADLLTIEVVDCAADHPASGLSGSTIPVAETEFAAAVAERQHAVVEHLGKAATWPAPLPGGPASVAPLVAAGTLHGLLLVAHRPGERREADADLTMISAFAGQAALALERAHAQEEREMFVVLEDRERIARDLHDVVIQRLFATGLQLQTAATLAFRPEVASRINAAVDELDITIRDIRSAIFELRTPMSGALRAELREVVEASVAPLGFRPVLEITGPVDSAASDEIRSDLLAVAREALSNVVRHARASTVRIGVRAELGMLSVTVVDNGVGTDASKAKGGLANMRERAARHGGTFEVLSGNPSGTEIRWMVPV